MDAATFDLPWGSALTGCALLLRASAFVSVAPIFGHEAVPPQSRIAFAVLLVVLLGPIVPAPPAGAEVVVLVAGELFIGFVLGMIARMVTEVLMFAGTMAGYPTGLAAAQMMDPVGQTQSTSLAVFYQVVGTLVLLAIGGHRDILGAFARSYEVVPVGGAHFSGAWLPGVVALTGRVIVLGFRLAAPLLVAGLLADLCMMLIARAVPQMNIMVVGAPIRVAVGLVALALSLHVFAPVVREALETALTVSGRFLGALAHAG